MAVRHGLKTVPYMIVFVVCVFSYVVSGFSLIVIAQTAPPELTQPVNDFARVIDPDNAAAIDKMSRALKAASGDVVVVATVPDIDGYGGDPAFHRMEGASPAAVYAGTVELEAGDSIDLAVGYGTNRTHYSDTTGLSARIELSR